MHYNEENRPRLEYPNMREELLETLQSLADAEYQQKNWLDQNFPPGTEHDCFGYAVHFIYSNPNSFINSTTSLLNLSLRSPCLCGSLIK